MEIYLLAIPLVVLLMWWLPSDIKKTPERVSEIRRQKALRQYAAYDVMTTQLLYVKASFESFNRAVKIANQQLMSLRDQFNIISGR